MTRNGWSRRALAIIGAFACVPVVGTAHATAIYYDVTYQITSLYGTHLSSLAVGDLVSVSIAWDASEAVHPCSSCTFYVNGPITQYSMNIAGEPISQGGPYAFSQNWSPGDTSLYALDVSPDYWASPFDISFMFTCANWSSLQQLPSNLGCQDGLTGSMDVNRAMAGTESWRLIANLVDIKTSVPEPGTLALLGLGLAGLGLSRRRKAN